MQYSVFRAKIQWEYVFKFAGINDGSGMLLMLLDVVVYTQYELYEVEAEVSSTVPTLTVYSNMLLCDHAVTTNDIRDPI